MMEEYTSLREELMKWQDRRIVFTQVALTLVTAYTGYMMSNNLNGNSYLTWQLVSLFPLVILGITMHTTRLFELFHHRIGTYLEVFYDSSWENLVTEVSLSKNKIGYNKSLSLIFFIIASSSIYILILKYQNENGNVFQTIVFGMLVTVFLIVFGQMFFFDTADQKKKLRDQWRNLKRKQTVH